MHVESQIASGKLFIAAETYKVSSVIKYTYLRADNIVWHLTWAVHAQSA